MFDSPQASRYDVDMLDHLPTCPVLYFLLALGTVIAGAMWVNRPRPVRWYRQNVKLPRTRAGDRCPKTTHR